MESGQATPIRNSPLTFFAVIVAPASAAQAENGAGAAIPAAATAPAKGARHNMDGRTTML